jgi:hypothetical protein
MAASRANRTIALRRTLGAVVPPDGNIQEAFEGNDRRLRRLLRIKPGERPDPHLPILR